MLTTLLLATASALATMALVLVVMLIRRSRRPTPVPVPAPAAPQPEPPPPAAPAATHDFDALARDLHELVVRYREPPAPEPRPVASAPHAAPLPDRGPAGSAELGELLAQTLEAARAIPGADAALVAVTPTREPIIGTLGLARIEADRLASTLPSARGRARSISIGYEYEDQPEGETAPGRIECGIAVPVPGVAVPALIAILTRAPAAQLGEPQLILLEEVARRLAPALAAVLEVQATPTPVSVSVHELDRDTDAPQVRRRWSAEGEEREERSQVDRLGRR